MYAIRDSEGKFVGRSHSKVGAHRATRRVNRAGTRVDVSDIWATLPRKKTGSRAFKQGDAVRIVRVKGMMVRTERDLYSGPATVAEDSGGASSVRVVMPDGEHRYFTIDRVRRASSSNRAGSLNMARLSSRGRTELARVSKETTLPPGGSAIWERSTRTLMSDRSILEKRDVRFKPDQYDPKGKLHSYGWKVLGKLKQGLDPQSFADIYAKKGYVVEKIASFGSLAEYKKPKSRRPSVPRPATVARREREAEEARGFYVVNSTTDGIRLGPDGPHEQLAANHGPFATLDEALPVAWKQMQEYLQMKFTYLLPVKIIESESKEAAERGVGRVWWIDGKRTGSPVPREQLALNMRRRAS